MRLLVLFLLLLATPALACSPPVQTLTYAEKVTEDAFIGVVIKVTEPQPPAPGMVTFQRVSSRKPSGAQQTMVFYADHGTCGRFHFALDDVWLYAGDDTFGATTKLTPEDMGSDEGRDFEAVVQRINTRMAQGALQ